MGDAGLGERQYVEVTLDDDGAIGAADGVAREGQPVEWEPFL